MGGLSPAWRDTPETDPVNYLPRVRIPVLMINGGYDYIFPVETAQKPVTALLGTPEEHKSHYIAEDAGHLPPPGRRIS